MGILFGLLAALFWGLGDYLITNLTRNVGTARALFFIQILSLLAWILILILGIQGNPPSSADSTLWLLAIITGVFHVAGLALTYRAFEVGTLSLVSPIASGFAVVTAILSFLTGEHPPALTVVGAICLIGGLLLATRTPTSTSDVKPSLAGVPEALGSAVAFGTMFWLFYFHVQPKIGYVAPLIILKVMASSASLVSVLAAKKSTPGSQTAAATAIAATSTQRILLLALGAAGADTLAWLAYIWGSNTQYATVVTALASLFSVVTILLAWALLRERLATYQWIGVATILLGILLVSI